MVESNVCWNSKNHCIQIQGDAIVRNNIAINAGGAAFYTRDHQGPVDKLQVYHNTFVNQGNAVELRNWAGKNKMQFLNNACYSLSGDAIKVVAGADGALIAKNVCFGQVSGLEDGFSKSKKGLADFMNLRLDASARDARPAKSSSLSGRAEPIPEFTHDLYRIKRPRKPSVGAVEPRSTDIRRLQAKEYSVKLRTKKMPKYDDSFWQSEEPGPAWSFLSHSYKKQQWTLWWPPAPKQ